MTALAQGASVTLSVGDGGYVTFATNGGFGSATITPTTGAASSVSFGPWAHRQKLGPFSEGASVTLVNTSCGSFDYDFDVGNSSAVAALVSGAGNPPDLLTGTVQRVTITGALSTTATQAAAATGTYYKARVVWNNNGASPGAAAVTLTGSPFTYTAPADGSLAVSGGTVSSITISRRGATAVSAGVTAGTVALLAGDVVVITYSSAPTVNFLYATPTKLRIAVNADNDVHGLMIGQSAKRRDYEMTMGDGVMLVCGVPITRLTFSADGAVTGGTHSLQVAFGN